MASYAASLLLESLLLHHQTHQVSSRLQKAVQNGGSLRAVARPAVPHPLPTPSGSSIAKLAGLIAASCPDRASRVAAELAMARAMLLHAYLRTPTIAVDPRHPVRLLIPHADDEALLEAAAAGGGGRRAGGKDLRPGGLTYGERLASLEDPTSSLEYFLEAGCGYGPIGSR